MGLIPMDLTHRSLCFLSFSAAHIEIHRVSRPDELVEEKSRLHENAIKLDSQKLSDVAQNILSVIDLKTQFATHLIELLSVCSCVLP